MIVATIIVSIIFMGTMLFIWIHFLGRDNNYNQKICFQGGRGIGTEEGVNNRRIVNPYDKADTVVRGMKVPTAPVTSSFAGLPIRLYLAETGQYYDVYLENQVLIGRTGGSAFVQLNDPMVSHKHCSIYRKGEQVLIQDLGSTNHTYLNGCMLESPMPLSVGDNIKLGQSTLLFQYFTITQ